MRRVQYYLFIIFYRYTKTAAGVGIHAQKYNPEVRLEKPDTSVYSLIEELRAVRRVSLCNLRCLSLYYICFILKVSLLVVIVSLKESQLQ
ncbi:hypothetical protein E2C01_090384 [Portunus trituberculatus]|uniref:Uncharacterized protein n=1 Tax=Portunus trituberculatus TaxID=210409 RepID=A0A5B7JLP0_PORTR|nr:hypothetical protein [Portunus trituberculatus]